MVDKKYASNQIKVHLVDFGFADKFISEDTRKHIDEKEQLDMFQGNLMFASLDQMNFYKTSRKDDLLSLFYLMVHLLNNDSFVCKNDDEKKLMNGLGASANRPKSLNHQFIIVRKYKEKNSISELAKLLVEKMDIFAKDKFMNSNTLREQDQTQQLFQKYFVAFAEMIDSMEFKDKPLYNKMENLL